MSTQIRSLKAKSNEELVSLLKLQVENERKLLMEILYALREVEERKLHLEMGYPNLYTFAMKELGYSSGAAYRRISAMRLLKSMPDVAPKLASGELGLENASQAQSYFRKEDQRRREQGERRLTIDEKREVVTELFGKSSREGQRALMERAPEIMTPTEKLRPLYEQKTLVQFVANAELMGKLEELKHLLAHQNFEGRMDVLIEQLSDIALKKLKPVNTAVLSKPESASHMVDSSPAPGMQSKLKQRVEVVKNATSRSRYIPVNVKRKVLARDQKGCTYQDAKTGRACGSRHGLQFDHIVPFSHGGAHSVDNLTLRCGAHNRYRAEQMGLFRAS